MTPDPDRSLDLAVARLADATRAGDAVPAAVALGHERGSHGVGLGQALDDLEVVHRIVTSDEPPAPVVRAFADAWADAAITVLLGRGALDERTGLATIEFLATRLRDVARCGRSGEYRLALVRCGDGPRGRLGALLRLARVASELARSFPSAETPVGLPDGRIVAIIPLADAIAANLAAARLALRRVVGAERAELELLDLPGDEHAVTAFVRDL